MEVRNRKKSFGSSTTTISDEMYTSKNNYGFSKASKKTYEENYSVMSNPSDPQPLRGHDQYMDESEIQYPDNIGTFADGLKGDIFELFETGAKVLNKSFKLLLPFGSESYGSGTVDVMKDIEIRSPLANVTNRSNSRPVQAATRTVSKSPFKTAEDAIRMRCSSMWKKEAPINGASEPFLPMPRKDLFPSQGPNMRVKEGVRVQLNKLSSGSGSIQSFECCDESILLVGNRRIILASKNDDGSNTGTVVWSQPLHDIDSCTITFNSNPTVTSPTKVRLELSTQGGKLIRKVSMPNTLVCSKALQVIQDRKVRSGLPEQAKTSSVTPMPAEDLGESVDSSTMLTGDGEIKYIPAQERKEEMTTSSDDLVASISALIAATREGTGTRSGALVSTPKQESGNPKSSSGSAKKSPELVAADALIADITAILKNLELKSSTGNCGSGFGGPVLGSSVAGPIASDSEYASPMKRACYGHDDSEFSGAITKGGASPAASILLSFTPGGDAGAFFSHGKSNLSPHSGSSRKKQRGRKNNCHHRHFGESNTAAMQVQCNHSECVGKHGEIRLNGGEFGATCSLSGTGGINGVDTITGIMLSGSGFDTASQVEQEATGRTDIVHGDMSVIGSDEVNIDKFRKMLNLGVPSGAVKQKMAKEGFDPDLLTNAPANDAKKQAEDNAKVVTDIAPKIERTENQSTESKDISKFKKMLKAGVLLEAVKHKMRAEGLDPALLESHVTVAIKLSEQEEQSIEKYKKMLKAGVPLDAVKFKMKAEGIDPELLDGPKPKAMEAPKLSPEEEKAIEKYKKMLKAGVPLDAVKLKMKAEGIDPALLEGPGPKAAPVVDAVKLKKYQMMLKAGVDSAAVLAKMAQEGCSKEEQAFVTGQSADTPTPPPVVTPNNLIALHWDPMAHNDLKDSIWGKLQGSDKIKGLGEDEMERLASMFGKKEKKEKAVEEKKPEEKSGGPPKLTVIDTTRGMNISIGLTSFKSQGITVEQMGAALEVLDTKFLGLDCLLRIKEILPNDAEIKSLQGFNAENGHPAEVCLYMLSQVSRVRVKVDSMIFMSTMTSTGSHITQSLITLREVAGRILISEGLKEIMVSVLAIGNAMNQGNWKGCAVGFKLGSLIKLAQTKSTDGKNTLIDYLILVLHERAKGGSAVCESALLIDEELGLVKKSKHISMSEITKDCSNLQREASGTSHEAHGVIDSIHQIIQTTESPAAKNNLLETLQSLENFQTASALLVTSVSHSLNETQSKFKELAAFFGEDQANVGSILTTLSEFIDHFSAAKQSFNRKNRKRPLHEK